MKAAALLALLLLTGCSDITAGDGGVISLQVRRPEPAAVEVGDTIQLSARALDRNGDSVAAQIVWRTADTTIAVDSVTGRVTGVVAGLTGRVQAAETSLISQPITLTVTGAADTLAVPADTLIVLADAPASAAIRAAVLSRSDTAVSGFVPAQGVRMIVGIVSPAFGDVAARTVELPGGVLVDTLVTGPDGLPAPAVTVNRISGRTAPDTVRLSIAARHRSGTTVAGSDQQIILLFQ